MVLQGPRGETGDFSAVGSLFELDETFGLVLRLDNIDGEFFANKFSIRFLEGYTYTFPQTPEEEGEWFVEEDDYDPDYEGKDPAGKSSSQANNSSSQANKSSSPANKSSSP
jgi:hypothetical protein